MNKVQKELEIIFRFKRKTNSMKTIEVKWTDINGKNHKRKITLARDKPKEGIEELVRFMIFNNTVIDYGWSETK